MIAATTSKILFFFFFTMLLISPSQAANWIFLQGTEEKIQKEKHYKLFGFMQPTYQFSEDKNIPAGSWQGEKAVFNQMAPDLKTSSGFQLFRARVGVRGNIPQLEKSVNYFILSEWGNNGITAYGKGSSQITDASLTISWSSWLKTRIGQFKYPGSEEGLRAIFKTPYIQYTSVSNQLLLERFYDHLGDVPNEINPLNGPVGAFRDIGIEFFEKFQIGSIENTYALMIGNGNGIGRGDNNKQKDLYIYWASEDFSHFFKWKLNLWGQWGTRTYSSQNYGRSRSGIGLQSQMGSWTLGVEWIQGQGAIFAGTDGGSVPGTDDGSSNISSNNILPEESSLGGSVELAYRSSARWQNFIRFDQYDRAIKSANSHRRFMTGLLGFEYSYSKNFRFIFNYEIRRAEAPHLGAEHPANKILSIIGDRALGQVVLSF